MRPIPAAILVAGTTLAACKSGNVETVNRADASPPVVQLTVSARDPETNRLRSTQVEAGGDGARLTARPGQVIISAAASDPSGVKKVSVWTIGDTLTDPARGEVVNPPRAAYRNTSTLVSMELKPGQEIGVFASGRNFNTGTELATSTAFTPIVVVTATGVLEPLPSGTREQTIRFQWSDTKRAYVAEGVGAPAPGATVVGVSPGNPFGGGRIMSLYRGRTDIDIDMLDLRADFVRVFQGSRAGFFGGPWSNEPWYALQILSRTRAVVADEFTIDVHWVVGRP